jgi:hypothetical protein
VLAASIIREAALMMEAASTRHYNPEDTHLHTRRRETFKAYLENNLLINIIAHKTIITFRV